METKRTCGGCTECCKTHGVRQLSKPGGSWCVHCHIGNGCRIYNERPRACQEFKCAWLMGAGTQDQRPDMTGIVPDYRVINSIGIAMWFFEAREGEINSDFTRGWTRRNLGVGNYVFHVPISGRPKLYKPDGADGSDPIYMMESGQVVEIVPFVRDRF